jgi:hypothetical protein
MTGWHSLLELALTMTTFSAFSGDTTSPYAADARLELALRGFLLLVRRSVLALLANPASFGSPFT